MPSLSPNLVETQQSDLVWQTLTIDQTLAQLETDARMGLTDRQAAQRREQFGSNELVAAG
jgi:magnesium-transporting ATPase (P-type)